MADQNHNSTRLKDKVVLVTGGSRGIGAAIVRRLSSEGAKIAFSYSASPDEAQKIVAEIEAGGGEAAAIKADAADPVQVKALVDQTVERFGRLDILVNNAGIFLLNSVTDLTDQDYEKVFNVNVRAVFTAVREASKHLGEGGRIITIGSVNGQRIAFPGGSLYAASKFAVKGFTQGWSRDLAPKGITVNVVQPGPESSYVTGAAINVDGGMEA